MTTTNDMPYREITVRAVTADEDIAADHYHVFAVQDWGGRHQYARGWDDRLALADAKQLVADMIRADAHSTPAECEALLAEFGDRFEELVSTNVNPGWCAIWILNCDDHCVFDLLWCDFLDAKPYWTANDGEDTSA